MVINNKIIETEIQELKERFKDLPHISMKDILWIWMQDYYDGILAAVGMYKGEPVYIKCVSADDLDAFKKDENDDSDEPEYAYHPRVFTVEVLTSRDFLIMLHKNLLWKKYVGRHNEMLAGEFRRDPVLFRTCDGNLENYDQYKRETEGMIVMDERKIVGYCTNGDMEIGEFYKDET